MEELRKYLEERRSILSKILKTYVDNNIDTMMKHHRFASKIETYQEIIDYIDNIKNK